ncbi:MAG: polysaccharide deacetylase family protein [Bacteriovorax sp.]|nr:polysaccharide deacetylase family protein [Bacteriovorax sp.]
MLFKSSMSYPLVFCFFLSSCAGYMPHESVQNHPVVSIVREPSSSMGEENLKISFDGMMNSAEPEKEFLAYLDVLKSIFIRAESGLNDFDKELDESVASATGVSFENSKAYKKMIVMWGLSHRLQDKIIFHYLSLTDMSYDKSINSAKRKVAKNILLKFKKKLDSNDVLEKISYDELKNNIAASIRERRGMSNKSVSPTELPSVSFKDEQEKIQLLRQYREKFRTLGKAEQFTNDELNQKIEGESDKLQLVDQKGREPQQSDLKFYPSTGPNGNVMGLIFPKNVWALTYDDGPSPVHTPVIVKNLNDLGIKATFFWLAENVIRYQSIVDLVRENGLPRGNHSWTHPQLPKLDDVQLQKEIVQSTDIDTKAYGVKPKFFRCPYGAGNSVPRIRKMIADLDMIHVFWNVDTLDWQDKDPDSIVARAQKQMKAAGHGVILFHDIHPQSVVASRKLVEWSQTLKGSENEIRWVTIPEIINEMNGAGK